MDKFPRPYYQDDTVTMYHADCRDILPLLDKASVDLVLTDPPYGIEFRGNEWDSEIPQAAIELPSMFSRVAIIMAPERAWSFPRPRWVACWARPGATSRSCVGGFNHWSPILLYGDIRMPVDFKSVSCVYPSWFSHPSPKPERLMEWLVDELSEEGQTILDPFAGSGTTLVAAKRLGRKAIGVELEQRYCDIAVKRLAQEQLL